MTEEQHEFHITGSCLKIDAHMTQIKDLLIALKLQLVESTKGCRTICESDETRHEQMLAALRNTSDGFNTIVELFREISDIRRSIDKLACGELPAQRLEEDMRNGTMNVTATDEGFAESLVAASLITDPIDRQYALCICAGDLAEAITAAEERRDCLKARIKNGAFDKSNENRIETRSAKSMLDSTESRIATLERRLERTLDEFFKTRKELLDQTAGPTRRLASVFPKGNSATRKGSRVHDMSGAVDFLSVWDNTFKNPASVVPLRAARRRKSA